MWICVLTCPNCAYESNEFTQGFDIFEQTCTVLFVRKSDKQFHICVITETELKAHGADMDTGEGLDSAILAMATAEEDYVKLPFGQDASIEAKCPDCGNIGLNRKITGMI